MIATANAADSSLRRAWSLLDLENLDASAPAFRAATMRVLVMNYALTQTQAERFLASYRLAETGNAAGAVVRPAFDAAGVSRLIDDTVIGGTKYRIARGTVDEVAFERSRRQMMAEAHRIIVSGSRGTIVESAGADSRVIGWRRVSDGDPCTFCAMLVSRGPAYIEYGTALKNSNAPSGWVGKYGNADPYHNHCACTVEPIYGDWQPTAAEQGYIDSYYEAAETVSAADQPRMASTVLPLMRANGTFKDSPARRAVSAATD